MAGSVLVRPFSSTDGWIHFKDVLLDGDVYKTNESLIKVDKQVHFKKDPFSRYDLRNMALLYHSLTVPIT